MLTKEAIMHFFRGLTIPVIPEDDQLSGAIFDLFSLFSIDVLLIFSIFCWLSIDFPLILYWFSVFSIDFLSVFTIFHWISIDFLLIFSIFYWLSIGFHYFALSFTIVCNFQARGGMMRFRYLYSSWKDDENTTIYWFLLKEWWVYIEQWWFYNNI